MFFIFHRTGAKKQTIYIAVNIASNVTKLDFAIH